MTVKIDNSKMVSRLQNLIVRLDTNEKKKLGRETINIIKERTRKQGAGVKKVGGRIEKLKKVTPEYAKWRKAQKRHPQAARGRSSNLTLSGKLLNSMTIISQRKNQIVVGFKDKLSQDKADGQREQGRVFLFLSRGEISRLSRFAKFIFLDRDS